MTAGPDFDRYSRQVLFSEIGEEGQRRLQDSTVVCIGCGALGTVLANTLVRAGVGRVRVVDRDFVETSNLQRQVLYDEADVAEGLPKAEAAARKLRAINSSVEIEGIVADVNPGSILRLVEGADVIVDGADNFETRFLVNDVSVKLGTPWVYGACVGATGLAMPIIPNETPCLQCIFEFAPPAEMNPTCDTAGVLSPIVNIVASHQALETMKLLMGRHDDLNRRLLHYDGWHGDVSFLKVQKAYELGSCACCKGKTFKYLDGDATSQTTSLCGRNAVQILPPSGSSVDFAAVAERVAAMSTAEVQFNKFILKATFEGFEIALFPDGRAIVKGTKDSAKARGVYAKAIGT